MRSIFAKLNLEWLINKRKAEPDNEELYDKIIFEKIKIEQQTGKPIKLNIQK